MLVLRFGQTSQNVLKFFQWIYLWRVADKHGKDF